VYAWRQQNIVHVEGSIVETVPFDGNSFMVWGCVSLDCKFTSSQEEETLIAKANKETPWCG